MLAVTTRNRLRSARFCAPMLLARRRIARQLAHQPGLVRYASGVRSPTEFFTLTVWETRDAMQRFMQTGAHEQHMWQFTRWTSSFWGMRWEPTTHEVGAWRGLSLAHDRAEPRRVSPLVTTGILPSGSPRAGPLGPRPEFAAIEPSGSGVFALSAWFEGTRAAVGAWRVRNAPTGERGLVRWGLGLDWSPQALSLSLWRDQPGTRERALQVAHANGATWAMCWQPADYEIGHWDHLRLRQAARRQATENVAR